MAKISFYFFIVFIISVLTFGTIYIGGISVRVMIAGLMAIYLMIFYKSKSIEKKIDKSYINNYIVMLSVLGLMLIINGDIIDYQFFKKIFSHYLICILAFLSIDKFIQTKVHVLHLSVCILLLILADSIVTILQYQNDITGWIIGQMFSDISENESFFENYDSAIGVSITPGIFGHVVNNALNISILAPLGFIVIRDDNAAFYYKIFACLSLFVAVYACAVTQQRAAFGFFLLQIFLIIYNIIGKKKFIIICSCLLAPIILYVGVETLTNMDETMLGRFAKTETDSRNELSSLAYNFIGSNFIIGGPVKFTNMTGYHAHNIVLDALISGGVFLFVVVFFLYAKTIKVSIQIIREVLNRPEQIQSLVLSASLFFLMLYGLFHNVSYMTGDVIVFIILALALKVYKINHI